MGGNDTVKNRIALKDILFFVWPIMLANILQITFNFADTLVVGNYVSNEGLAAVGTASPITIFFTWGMNGLSLGANVLISRMIGAKEYERLDKAVFSAIAIGGVFGTVIALFGFLFSGKLLELVSAPADIISLSTSYMRIFFLACIGIGVFDFGASALRADGNTKDPTLFLAIAGALNVLLNLLFVAGFRMGVVGAAWATVISQMVGAILIVIRLMKGKGLVSLKPDIKLLDYDLIGLMLKYGIPSALQNQLFSFSNVMIQSSINSFGSTFVAASTAANAIEEYVYVFVDAFPLASLTFISRLYGAKDYKQIRRTTFMTFLVCGIGAFAMGLTIVLNGQTLLSMLSDDPEVIRMGMYRLRYVTLFLFLNGLLDVIVNSSRGMGMVNLPTIITLFGVCGFRLLYLYTYFASHHTPEVLFSCFPLSWILTMSMQLLLWIRRYREVCNMEE
ncbi:MAG: MATE family efflux transporter [Erysipelotrichaceae bacterium]|nr:MATE family efflux transporter [Erysipelotrichaceae bacterium]